MRQPRRFGLVFQIDPLAPGTSEQQQAVRDALHPSFGTLFHALIFRLAVTYKRKGRSHISVGFVNLAPQNRLGFAGSYFIRLHEGLTVSAIRNIARHELGHVVEQNDLITQADKTWFMEQLSDQDRDWSHFTETFADAVRDWINSDGERWSGLTPILTRAL